jgi:hypothetical protein
MVEQERPDTYSHNPKGEGILKEIDRIVALTVSMSLILEVRSGD